MTVKLLTEHHLEFLSLKEGCTASCESTLVKVPHCWKSHVAAHMFLTHISLAFFMWEIGKQCGNTGCILNTKCLDLPNSADPGSPRMFY